MDAVEFALKILPFNDELPRELAKLQAEGWDGVSGLVPAISYVMFRPVQVVRQDIPGSIPEVAGNFRMAIDDSKVTVVKGNGDARK